MARTGRAYRPVMSSGHVPPGKRDRRDRGALHGVVDLDVGVGDQAQRADVLAGDLCVVDVVGHHDRVRRGNRELAVEASPR